VSVVGLESTAASRWSSWMKTAPDRDPRRPAMGRRSGGGRTRRCSTTCLALLRPAGKERGSGGNRSTRRHRQRFTSVDGGDARMARPGVGWPFYCVCEERRRDGWQPGGWTMPTCGPGVSLSATDRWAALQLFSNSKITAEIELSMRK
jgi:hypothetical protein